MSNNLGGTWPVSNARGYLFFGGGELALVTGLGTIDYIEPAVGGNHVTQIVLDSSSDVGRMTGTVTATRGSKSVVVHFDVYRTTGECFSRAHITPSA